MTKCFYEIFLNIAKFQEKTATRSADIKNISAGGKGCVHSPLPPFIDEGNGQVRNRASYKTLELLKRVGISRRGIHQGELDEWEFSGWKFSR